VLQRVHSTNIKIKRDSGRRINLSCRVADQASGEAGLAICAEFGACAEQKGRPRLEYRHYWVMRRKGKGEGSERARGRCNLIPRKNSSWIVAISQLRR